MKRKRLSTGIATATVVAAAILAGPARGQHPADVQFAAYQRTAQQISMLESELDSLRAELVSYGGPVGDIACGDIACYDRRGGWHASVEAVIVKPFFSHGTPEFLGAFTRTDDDINDPANAIDTEVVGGQTPAAEWDLNVTPRIVLGYENCEGLGVRVRWWQFDQNARTRTVELEDDDESTPFTFGHGLDIDVIDVEAYQRLNLCSMGLTMAGGVRWGRVETNRLFEDFTDPNDETVRRTSDIQFDGFGPTVALDARIPLSCCGWALVGGTRASLLYGDTDFVLNSTETDNGSRETETASMRQNDDLAYVLETSLGAEYTRDCGRLGVMSLRAALEAQIWGDATDDSFILLPNRLGGGHPDPTSPPVSKNDDLGFVGFSLGVTLLR